MTRADPTVRATRGPANRLFEAYDLVLQSEIDLPELLPSTGVGREPDVSISYGKVLDSGVAGGVQLGPFLWASEREFRLHIPGVARFLVHDGTSISVDPEPGADGDSIRVFLLGSIFGALLYQRGRLVLHGNAVAIGGSCIVCVGPSGAGKSTLAAGFQRRSFPVLADDVVAVDEQGRALPGFPRIKLWHDVAERFELETETLRRVRPALKKYNLPLGSSFGCEALPITRIYVLSDDHVDTVKVEELHGMAKFLQLLENTYRSKYLEGMGLKPRHLNLCGELANRVKLARLTRPRGGFTLDPLIDSILKDVDGN